MSRRSATDGEQLVADQLARHPDLGQVLERHGMTAADLVRAWHELRSRGMEVDDVWLLINHAARSRHP